MEKNSGSSQLGWTDQEFGQENHIVLEAWLPIVLCVEEDLSS